MRQKSMSDQGVAEKTVQDIRRRTRQYHSMVEKIRVVLSGLRGQEIIAELCRREGIAEGLYYSWSKEFLKAGKKRVTRLRQSQGNTTKGCDLLAPIYNWFTEGFDTADLM